MNKTLGPRLDTTKTIRHCEMEGGSHDTKLGMWALLWSRAELGPHLVTLLEIPVRVDGLKEHGMSS